MSIIRKLRRAGDEIFRFLRAGNIQPDNIKDYTSSSGPHWLWQRRHLRADFFFRLVGVPKCNKEAGKWQKNKAGPVWQTNGTQVTDANMYQAQHNIILRKCLSMEKWPQAYIFGRTQNAYSSIWKKRQRCDWMAPILPVPYTFLPITPQIPTCTWFNDTLYFMCVLVHSSGCVLGVPFAR